MAVEVVPMADGSGMRQDLARNLAQIEEDISAACRAAGRSRAEIELMAVSKVHPSPLMVDAVALGLHVFGENRVQEFASKSAELSVSRVPGLEQTARSEMQVHLIGHLQSNKAAKAVEVFDAIDSVDSLKLAERLDEAVARSLRFEGKRLPVLVEIKLSDEDTKAGIAPDSHELSELLERLPSLKHLQVRGLMTIAPFGVPDDQTRTCFKALRVLRDKLAQAHPRLNLPVLSMGMSGDFALAIAEGSTQIRVGTALFGRRPKPLEEGIAE